ncbi:NADPH:quinone reductase-like Zn-dependent oxidoreductase [Isoptericola jiangsuensis]|uniref:NADPH:quinone reductase-like Zn-dependent oxidoreductase n=1 Tax=Isoptericola jiangsuensis TaxID=548579 RepID=A0A2A9EUR7_9MICO|nr:NAD(P)-dependent alcohol dehydrogenase [Isoptericola jiangsuensis]PFG42022.1 NADPH:quinone reductase-like Zn-dependent oxidoreductase [Isoptericola jiangsuensis]
MRAIVQDAYGSPDVLRLADVDEPRPGRGQVTVRVRAAALDASVWYRTTGRPVVARLGFGLARPRVPLTGQELAGEVVAVGEGVTALAVGDEVFGAGQGAFGEVAVARADKLALRPPAVTPQDAAALVVSGTTALAAVRAARLAPGATVLVTGAGGGVGSYVVQLATAAGARVTAVAGPDKADLVHRLGAVRHLDHTREPVTAAGAHDVVVDVAGNRPLRELRRALTPRGTMVLVGAGVATTGFLGGAERSLRGALWSPFLRQRLHGIVAVTRPDDLTELAAAVADGRLVPAVERVRPLDEVPDAVRELGAGHARGKTVVLPHR